MSPLGPWRPWGPCSPVSPLGPWRPWGPCSPVSPLGPTSPWLPCGPCSPGSPLSPLGPGVNSTVLICLSTYVLVVKSLSFVSSLVDVGIWISLIFWLTPLIPCSILFSLPSVIISPFFHSVSI